MPRIVRVQGKSSKGKKLIREVGHEWMLLERHDAYLVVSPVTRPGELRTVLTRGDPNLYLESPLPDEV